MIVVQVCVGSSCHLKGSPEIVERLQRAIERYHLEDEIILNGSFCIGQCNRVGVTIQVGDTVHVGITVENFEEFFKEHILSLVETERK
jgi:NADH:ubiquinone oxidoreductase subunit E